MDARACSHDQRLQTRAGEVKRLPISGHDPCISRQSRRRSRAQKLTTDMNQDGDPPSSEAGQNSRFRPRRPTQISRSPSSRIATLLAELGPIEF